MKNSTNSTAKEKITEEKKTDRISLVEEYKGKKRRAPEEERKSQHGKSAHIELETHNNGDLYANSSVPPVVLNNLHFNQARPRFKKYRSNKHFDSQNKNPFVLSNINNEEKELILHERTKLGIRQCTRKWGMDHSMIKIIKPPHIFENTIARRTWVHKQKETIKNNLNSIKEHIQEIISKTYSNNYPPAINLEELCELSLDRGLAIMGFRYKLNLFELEVILSELFPTQWTQMKENKWFCVKPHSHTNKDLIMSKMDVVHLSNLEGVRYASKKTGLSYNLVVKYRKEFLAKGSLLTDMVMDCGNEIWTRGFK